MIEKSLKGDHIYWAWVAFLLVMIGIGFIAYMRQWDLGLGITGMGRDISWGLYIANFTFLVGVAASGVMVVLPYYLHNFKVFARITIFGEFLAVAAVTMAMLFIFVDLGQPARVFNIILYPSPHSVLFWDMIVLSLYLILNIIIGWRTLEAEHQEEAPPIWLKPLVFISIPLAFSIHTVTAFIFSGLGARPFWLTALLAPRFLASAFASGPAILIIMCIIMRRFAKFDIGQEATQKIALIITYALSIHIFFFLVEIFTVFYGGIPEHVHHFEYLLGRGGQSILTISAWISLVLIWIAFLLMINPQTRKTEGTLIYALLAVIIAVWIEKGLSFIVPGFIPSPLGEIARYSPTLAEIFITIGVWSVGILFLTVLYKVTVSIKKGMVS
ncbi:MAG TPA: polysulfide reductase NrfD [Syntrophorhabdus sp.]|jgi:molybdopterin-containing oxidoreductase family membrane subunit|nr:polysulfide reductase NrfD [Syntrophorhabdus sp.]OPX98216.1 MAG: Polysulfide reductase, NrfD [Syntrophorhabdus sp. PtaB.Bin027]HNQ47181.1 polysulfide reductase NrfD [Syntrophorhabdus sp.]HNS78426.1 polysulfide reductase NrfD [Syntrophorhabdus sp.]HOD77713.1 polysulfide reductase NrfD [Syntrophorhabdus sp.]